MPGFIGFNNVIPKQGLLFAQGEKDFEKGIIKNKVGGDGDDRPLLPKYCLKSSSVTDSYIATPYLHYAGAGKVSTFSFWYKATSNAGGQVLGHKGSSAVLKLNTIPLQNKIYVASVAYDSHTNFNLDNVGADIKEWNHYVYTIDGDVLSLVVNGELVNEEQHDIGNWTNDYLYINCYCPTAVSTSDGLMYDFRCFDRRLTPDEIVDTMAFKEPPSDIKAWWKMDDADGSMLFDSSGNDKHATIVKHVDTISNIRSGRHSLPFEGYGNNTGYSLGLETTDTDATFNVDWKLGALQDDDVIEFHWEGIVDNNLVDTGSTFLIGGRDNAAGNRMMYLYYDKENKTWDNIININNAGATIVSYGTILQTTDIILKIDGTTGMQYLIVNGVETSTPFNGKLSELDLSNNPYLFGMNYGSSIQQFLNASTSNVKMIKNGQTLVDIRPTEESKLYDSVNDVVYGHSGETPPTIVNIPSNNGVADVLGTELTYKGETSKAAKMVDSISCDFDRDLQQYCGTGHILNSDKGIRVYGRFTAWTGQLEIHGCMTPDNRYYFGINNLGDLQVGFGANYIPSEIPVDFDYHMYDISLDGFFRDDEVITPGSSLSPFSGNIYEFVLGGYQNQGTITPSYFPHFECISFEIYDYTTKETEHLIVPSTEIDAFVDLVTGEILPVTPGLGTAANMFTGTQDLSHPMEQYGYAIYEDGKKVPLTLDGEPIEREFYVVDIVKPNNNKFLGGCKLDFTNGQSETIPDVPNNYSAGDALSSDQYRVG